MNPNNHLTQNKITRTWIERIKNHGLFRGLLHMGKKALLIGLTIFIGIFITIVIMNRPMVLGMATAPPQMDATMEANIQLMINQYLRENPDVNNLPGEEREQAIEELRAEYRVEMGLELPYFQRHLHWTMNALRFDWGRLRFGERSPFTGLFRIDAPVNLNDIILENLPNTLLLVGTAYLIVFLAGLPLALFLARNYGTWFDRVISFFAPLSSIPAWVIGIILIDIFAFQLRILPAGRMIGALPPETTWGYILIVARHMVLPVAAIVLSLIFNLVYSWRTFFITFSSEDYVELGKAVGLPDRKIKKDYILKPSLSYVLTSFSLMFVSFWQMTMALEVVFSWPGIGYLYIIRGLPNLWGESVYPGDLIIAVSLVVMFAYMMGAIIFILDLVYVLVDPRVRFEKKDSFMKLKPRKRNNFTQIRGLFQKTKDKEESLPQRRVQPDRSKKNHWFNNDHQTRRAVLPKFQFWKALKRVVGEILRYPSAIIGFIVILILIAGSLYAVIFLPYEKIGEDWQRSHVGGLQRMPRLANPSWTNWFRRENLLSTLILNSREGDAIRERNQLTEEMDQILLTFTFDYDYGEFPNEVYLHFVSQFEEKRAFVSVLWRTPDGREFTLRDVTAGSSTYYDFDDGISLRRVLAAYPNFETWFDLTNMPAYYLLFADPDSTQPEIVRGGYEVVVDGLTFEPDADIEAEFVLLGQVYGLAGTDFYRRDLLVPLLWGMPFALLIGLGGALSTTIISMILAATGVWFGGWADNLVQRLIDMNLILPVLAIAVMAYAFLGIDLWTILIVFVILNAFGMPTKNFRAAFLQIKDAPYIEAARAYGTKSTRIITKYMVPRLIPVLIPQLVILIPAFVFLEATLGFFNIKMIYPTWGTVIFEATTRGGLYTSRFWVLQPIALLLLTGLGFSLFGFALERILNPRLSED